MILIAGLQELLPKLKSLRYELIARAGRNKRTNLEMPVQTEIQYLADEMRIEDLIEKEDVIITICGRLLLRTSSSRVPATKERWKRCNWKQNQREDYVEHLFVASTHDTP